MKSSVYVIVLTTHCLNTLREYTTEGILLQDEEPFGKKKESAALGASARLLLLGRNGNQVCCKSSWSELGLNDQLFPLRSLKCS